MKGIYIEDNILKRYIGDETHIDITPNFHLKEVAADAFPLDGRTYIIKLSYFTNENCLIYHETAGLSETFMSAFLQHLYALFSHFRHSQLDKFVYVCNIQ